MRWLCVIALLFGACDGGTKQIAIPAAVVIVLNDQERFMDDYLRWLEHAFATPLKLPKGSQGAVVGYARDTRMLVTMGPLDRVTGTALGPAARYHGRHGTEMARGIDRGIDELLQTSAKRRVLIVMGNNDSGLEAVRERAERLKIELLVLTPAQMVTRDDIAQSIAAHIARLPHTPVKADAPAVLVVVVNSQEIFAGNDQFETDPNASYQGWYKPIDEAFRSAPPHYLLPEGSLGMVIGYSTGTRVIVDMGPVNFTNAFSQHDAKGRIGTDMMLGMEHAFSELRGVKAIRKIMLVIGDGHDTNNEEAKPRLEKLREQAADERIEIRPILFRSHCHYTLVATVFGEPRCTNNVEGFRQHLREVLAP